MIIVLSLTASVLGLSTIAGIAADKRPSAALDSAQKYFLHLGLAAVPYDESSVITVGGAVSPGGDIGLDPNYTLAAELGFFLTPNFAIAIAGGYPPTETARAAGTLASFGDLGTVTGGITEVNLQYHVREFGAFQPYIGAGPAYFSVFGTTDRALSSFDVHNAFGFNFQIGADWMITNNIGLFFDVKKVLLTTTATGWLGPTPVVSNVKLDPTVISVGLTVRY